MVAPFSGPAVHGLQGATCSLPAIRQTTRRRDDSNLLRVLRPQTRHRDGPHRPAGVENEMYGGAKASTLSCAWGVQIRAGRHHHQRRHLAIGLRSLPLVAGSAELGWRYTELRHLMRTGLSAPCCTGRLSAVICSSTSDRSAADRSSHTHTPRARGWFDAYDPLKVARIRPPRGWHRPAIAWAAPQLKKGPCCCITANAPVAAGRCRACWGWKIQPAWWAQLPVEIALGLVRSDVRRLIGTGTQTAQSCMSHGRARLWRARSTDRHCPGQPEHRHGHPTTRSWYRRQTRDTAAEIGITSHSSRAAPVQDNRVRLRALV